METCDVLIAGGGPAGSTCAWVLRQAGLDVVVLDRATFPRDKVCAGWITPHVLTDLRLDVHGYRHGRTFQPFTGFRVGLIGRVGGVEATYDHPVSVGIRRIEFDDYLLQRSGARLRLGTPIQSIRRDGRLWVVNDCLKAPMLVGAGGHFCPVARLLNVSSDGGDSTRDRVRLDGSLDHHRGAQSVHEGRARTVRGPAARAVWYQPSARFVSGLALPPWTNLGSLADRHAVVRSAGVAQPVVSARARTGSHACLSCPASVERR